MGLIDILVPVLARPQNAQRLVQSIRATCDLDIVFLCSPGDDAQIAACEQTGAIVEVVGWQPGKADFARKINFGVRQSSAEYVFMAADDLDFDPDWDTHALSQRASVVGTNDMANGSVRRGLFSTHCLVERRYVTERGATADEEPGVLLCELYDHNFVDRELCGVAMHRQTWAFSKRSIVRHRHPLFGTAPDDDTYRKSLRLFHRDRMLFYRRAPMWDRQGLSDQERRLVRGHRRGGRVAI